MPAHEFDWLTTATAAEQLSITRQRVGQLIGAGSLEAIRVGPRVWLVSQASVQARLDQRAAEQLEAARKAGDDDAR